MYEEVDLYKYVRALLDSWKWILFGGLIVALLALGVSFLLPPAYEATALVAVTRPRYTLQFDPRFETLENLQPAYEAYPELALNVEIAQDILSRAPESPDSIASAVGLQRVLNAETGRDRSLIHLTVRSSSPRWAAEVANLWAELFIEEASKVYGGDREEDLAFLSLRLQEARAELEEAEAALVEFESRNRAAVVEGELGVLRQTQTDYLLEVRGVEDLRQDILGLRARYRESPERPVTPGDRLTLLLLQIKVFDVQETVPFEIDLVEEGPAPDGRVVGYVSVLDELLSTLEAKEIAVTAELEALEPRILQLQQQLSEAQVDRARLVRRRDVAQETYLTLARKHEEVRITVEDRADEVKLVSRALPPEEPTGSGSVVYTLAGGMVGSFIAAVGVLLVASWREVELSVARDQGGSSNPE